MDALAGGGELQRVEDAPIGRQRALLSPPPESGALVCIRARVTQASEVGKPNVRGCVGSSPSITDRASVPNDGKISRGTRNDLKKDLDQREEKKEEDRLERAEGNDCRDYREGGKIPEPFISDGTG